MQTILAYRFSAFGDVLLTIPVLMGVLHDHEEVRIIMITRIQFAGYFPKHERLEVVGIDLHKGKTSLGALLVRVNKIARTESIDAVADLHSVIRSHVLNSYFILKGVKLARIKKSRKGRRQFLKGKREISIPSVSKIYNEVFEKLGFPSCPIIHPYKVSIHKKDKKDPKNRIGIAPLSKHATKNWPLSYTQKLISLLSERFSAEIFLFGSQEEHGILASMRGNKLNNMAGSLSSREEIELISSLDLMISLDSANMHLANLTGIPVLSIWGGTHPDMGFKPDNQPDEYLIQTNLDLACRPCSVFGTSECKLGSTPLICLTSISPENISDKIESILC